MAYDPRDHGALCHLCPLEGCAVVPPEANSGATIAVVGEAPGEQEEKIGRPFVGPSGAEFDRAVRAAGARRNDFHVTNAICCRPPDNDLKKLNTKISRYNKKELETAKEEGREPKLLALPVECCAPRLTGEIARFDKFITLGGVATAAITGNHGSILALRGGLQELSRRTKAARDAFEIEVPEASALLSKKAWNDAFDKWQKENGYMMTVMPTVHPAFVLRQQRWAHVFRNDVAKAVRAFKGIRGWAPPKVTYNPPPSVLAEFLSDKDKIYTFDIEADGIESLTAHIRCIAIGDEQEAMVVGFRSNTRPRDQEGLFLDFYSDLDSFYLTAILTQFFTDKDIVKVGHNCLFTGTPVLLGSGESHPIEDLVRRKYTGTVLAVNRDGELVEARVTDWFYNKAKDQDWIVIRREGEKKHSRGLTLTPDHEVYTTRGRVRADEVRVGDYILSAEPVLGQEEKQALLGTLLGDSCANCNTTTSSGMRGAKKAKKVPIAEATTALIRGSHADSDLVEQKVRWMRGILSLGKRRARSSTNYEGSKGSQPYSTPSMRQVADLARQVYKGNKRSISGVVLDQLGPIGLAWLFADDGFQHRQKGKKKEAVLIATCGFSQEEREEARAWFSEKFGPTTHTKNGSIRLGVEATKTFCLQIAPYLLPAARYKLPNPHNYGLDAWPEFRGFPGASKREPLPVRVESVQTWIPSRSTPRQKHAADSRWCIQTTEGNFMTGFGLVKNCGMYDRLVLRSQMGIDPEPVFDTILLHRNVESELPHSLAYVASLYTDAPAWKSDREGNKLALGGETDLELAEYCAKDVSITASCFHPLLEQVKLRDQVTVWKSDQRMQLICADMHMVGMYVDQKKRLAEEKKLLALRHTLLEEIRKRTGLKSFNPGSIYHMRDLLFKRWGLESHLAATDLKEEDLETSSGDLSTGDLILRTILTLRTVPDERRDIVKLIRRFRKVMKILGTYVVKLRPWNMGADLGWDEDDDWVTTEMRKKYGEVKMGIVDPATGRMHPGYNPQVAVCVDPQTWIISENGLCQIGSLPGFGPAQSEVIADGIRLHDGHSFATVSHLQNPGVCPTLRFTTVLGVTLTATPHHRVRVAERNKFRRQDSKGKWHEAEPNSVWRRMDAICQDDYVLVPFGMNVWSQTTPKLPAISVSDRTNSNAIVLPDKVDKELAYFVGVYNADGSLHDSNGSFAIRISDTRGKRSEMLQHLASRLFGPDAVRVNKEGIVITSVSLAPWTKALGLGRRIENKSAPWWVMASPKEIVAAYLKGLSLDSHTGTYGATSYWKYTGTEALCREVQMILLNMGIVTSIYDKTTTSQPLTWELLALGEEAHSVCTMLGVILPKPNRQGDTSQKRPKYIKRGQNLWLRVKSVEDAGLRQVYDVTIPSTHQFWANGTVSHNTGRLSSSKPINAQNFPVSQRGMIVAQPGHVLVGADMDQLELRIAAALWNVDLYLRAFREGKDPHSMTAYAVFGDAFCKAAGLSPEAFQKPGVLVGAAYDEHGVFQKGVSKEAKSMRDLSKAVQYASISKEEEVAVLDERGSIPICQVQRGDWVWAWSTTQQRYEPTRVKKAWPHGEKECVRVTFCWGAGGTFKGSVVVTADHPMLMRNGVLRHAGSLQANDRLMPFYRREIEAVRPADTVYRHVQPRNDGAFVGEHRVVKGFYAAGEDKTHIHHKNKNTRDNRPSNLEVLDHLDHYREHKDAIDAGRVNSPAWRAAVSDAKTRSEASIKAWEGRRERQDTDKTFGPRGSVLDSVKSQIGVKTDVEVATAVGCTPELVGMYRKAHGIAPPVGQKGWLRWLLTNDVLWNRLLHDNTDVEMARLVNEHFGVEATRDAVHQTRKLLGIPAVKKGRAEVYPRRASKLDAFADRVGHERDSVIAKEAGCTPEAVGMYRKKHGIPAYWKEAPGGNNHTVVSIESVGVREVWDIEVEHDDHNFALAAGIFVHNSQYMASVETVHQLIQKTELPATDPNTGKALDDGTTDLPYAKLPLKRVREMRDAWLKGAPEFESGWNKEIDEFRRQGHLRDPVAGRRRDFLDGEEPNQIVNFKVQGGAAGLMNKAIIQLYEEIPANKWGPGTGIINQCHDSIAVECPEEEAEKVAKLMEECMNQEHPALPGVKFSASAVIGKSWKDV